MMAIRTPTVPVAPAKVRRRMAKRLAIVTLALTVAAAAWSSVSGAATSQAARYLTSLCCVLKGSRATVTNPSASEVSIQSGDFFSSSAYADTAASGIDYLLQTGVTYEFNEPVGPSCNLGAGSPTLYYFVDVISNGIETCYARGNASFGEAHLQSVVRNDDGYWRAYRDGVYQDVRIAWSPCGGDACLIAAVGEEFSHKTGDWVAKFAGSGLTPWQRWTGSQWFTIQTANLKLDPEWTQGGSFPGGIWTLTYHKG